MKKITIILGIVFVQISLFAQIPTDSLILHLPFNGNALDESGNGNDGTVNGPILTEDRFGNSNSSYSFDGVDDEIVIPNINMPAKNVTISLWSKTFAEQSSSLFTNSDYSSSHYVNAHIHHPGIDSDIYWDYGDIGNGVNGVGRLIIPEAESSSFGVLNQWEHFVFISDKLNSTMKVYVNGHLSYFTQQADSINPSTFDLIIGGITNGSNNFHYNGIIDDIRIYKKVLNDCEVRALYFEGQQGNCSVYDTISVTDTLIIDAVLTGVNPPNNTNTITIYPNPAKTHIYINNGDYNSMNGYSVKIDNSLGQTVYTSAINQQELYINLSSWTGNGTYFVHIIDNLSNVIETKKIIVQ